MPQAVLRRRMRSMDAMFLYFEKPEMPLHIGSVAILDGSFDRTGEQLIESRLQEIPRYRQRAIFSPLNLTHPTWEFDPEFNFQNHIRRLQLKPPGTEAQLAELSGTVFTPLMDRGRPLWDLTIVDGLEGGRSALISRVHHCLVDGVSGVALMNIMFDPSRVPRKVEVQPFNPPPLSDGRQLLVEGLAMGFTDAMERVIDRQVKFLRFAQGFVGDNAMGSLRSLLSVMPELARPTDRLPFNRPCSGVRGHCWTTMSFAEARQIRANWGGTINDIALTIVSGAISRYVTAHREPVKGRFARLMVPVSLRTEEARGQTGNEVSMLPISVPLDVGDPLERLRTITMRSTAMKSARVADLISLIGTWVGGVPPMLQQSLAALPFLPQPMLLINTVCTNVPGPMIPIYANGRELLTYYPHVPVGSEIGIGVAIQSYNQKLHYGVTYDEQAAPDGELFRDFLVEAYEELRMAAGVAPIAAPAVRVRPAAGTAEGLRAHRAAPTTTPPAAEPEIPPVVAAVEPPPVVAAAEVPPVVAEPETPLVAAAAEPTPMVAEPQPPPVVAETTPATAEPIAPPVQAEPVPLPVVAEAKAALAVAAPESSPAAVKPKPRAAAAPKSRPVTARPKRPPVAAEPKPQPVAAGIKPPPAAAEPKAPEHRTVRRKKERAKGVPATAGKR